MKRRRRTNPLRGALPRARAKVAPSRVRKLRRLSGPALRRSQNQAETSPRGRRSRRLSSRPLAAELERRPCNSRPSSARPRLAVLVLAATEKLPPARCRMVPAPRRRSRWSLEVRELVPPPPEPVVLPGPAAPQEVRLEVRNSSRKQLLTDDQAHLPSELDPRLLGQVVSKPPRSWRRCLRKASLSMSSFSFSKDV
jgi:hypothetical protein